MAKNKGAENLIPLNKRTKDAQRAIQSKGGRVSAEKKQEKKLISQIYADILAKRLSIQFEDGPKDMTGLELVEHAVKNTLASGGAPAVSMLKEIREATEGSKTILANDDDNKPFEIKIVSRADK